MREFYQPTKGLMMKPSTKQHDDKNDIQGKSDIQKINFS